MTTKPTTRITIDLVPVRPGCDLGLALRWCLKRLLRDFGFRCRSIGPAEGEISEQKESDQ